MKSPAYRFVRHTFLSYLVIRDPRHINTQLIINVPEGANDVAKSCQLTCADQVNALVQESLISDLTRSACREVGEERRVFAQVSL